MYIGRRTGSSYFLVRGTVEAAAGSRLGSDDGGWCLSACRQSIGIVPASILYVFHDIESFVLASVILLLLLLYRAQPEEDRGGPVTARCVCVRKNGYTSCVHRHQNGFGFYLISEITFLPSSSLLLWGLNTNTIHTAHYIR